VVSNFLSKRSSLYQSLSGSGLEIGAFEHPAELPSACKVVYCDVITKAEALKLFPEINADKLPEIDVLVDIDRDGLTVFKNKSQDFVIINHVLEHLFDPVNAIRECFRVLKVGGTLVVSVPDKRFTFDKNRTLTTTTEIFERIKRIPKLAIPQDYDDMLINVHPELL
jgi:SAM-dependent methyltransferase